VTDRPGRDRLDPGPQRADRTLARRPEAPGPPNGTSRSE
jgi:hypothetical protein